MSDRNNMTKKHFIAIAFAVKELDLSPEDKRKVACAMADFCKTQNINFDRERFLTVCLGDTMFTIKGRYMGQRTETIDVFDTMEEAARMLAEYRIAFGAAYILWIDEN
jgi:hypothetical protein